MLRHTRVMMPTARPQCSDIGGLSHTSQPELAYHAPSPVHSHRLASCALCSIDECSPAIPQDVCVMGHQQQPIPKRYHAKQQLQLACKLAA